MLECRDERQLDRLATLVASVGGNQAVLELELVVGVGLDPDGLGDRQAQPALGVGPRAEVDRVDALLRPSSELRQVLVQIE